MSSVWKAMKEEQEVKGVSEFVFIDRSLSEGERQPDEEKPAGVSNIALFSGNDNQPFF